MDAGSWMEAFERASERLVADWQVKLVTTGLLAEGIFPVELISLFALAVFIDLVHSGDSRGASGRNDFQQADEAAVCRKDGALYSADRRWRCGRPASGKRGTAGPVYGNVCQLSGGVGDAEYRGESE